MGMTQPIRDQLALSGFLRLGADPRALVDSLGPLAHLVGAWRGNRGWNLIAVPQGPKGFLLLVRPYIETLTFTPIGAPVPNRGGAETLMILGLQYDLRITDAETNEPLHIENGMWLYWGENQDPKTPTIARQATIPHGVSALAVGYYNSAAGPPHISDNTAIPDPGKGAPLGYLEPYLQLVNGFSPANPNQTLQKAIKDQSIVETIALTVSTTPVGGVVNIPFIAQHADTTQLAATYWIEKVQVGDPATNKTYQYEQLQYSQQTDIHFIPRFDDPQRLIMWPHININTLVKQ
jgi:hypothetical protein